MVLLNYSGYAEVTTNTAKISGTSTEIVGYVDLSSLSSSWWDSVASDGSDIAVTSSTSDTKLDRELVGFDSTLQTGELFFGPIIVSSESQYTWRIYAGNESASETNSTSVWSSYVAVYHLNEDPTGTAPQIYNSATGTYQGTSNGTMTSDDLVTGKLGKALEFDSSNDRIVIPDYTISPQYDVMLWANRSDNGTGGLISKRTNNTANEFQIYNLATGNLSFIVWASGGSGHAYATSYTTNYPTGSWHWIRGTYDGAGGHYVYVNNNLEGTGPAAGSVNNTTGTIRLGEDHYGNYFGGMLDEVRIAGTLLSSDSASTEYQQQNDSSSFWSSSWVSTLVEPILDSSSSVKQSKRVVSTGPNTGRVETLSSFSFTPTQTSYIKSFSVMARGDEVGDSTVTATINGVTSNSLNVGSTTSNFAYRKFEFATPVKVEAIQTTVSFNINGSWVVLFGVLEESGWNITYE